MSDQHQPTGPTTPAGFYPDNTGAMRFWDGAQWTEHLQSGGAPPAAAAAPAKKSHTLRNIILVLIAVFVLFIGGCIALIGGAANEIDNAIDESESADAEPGGPDNPLEITEGEAFSVSGFDYAAGWSIGSEFELVTLSDLKVTNNRDEADSALIDVRLMQGTEVLAVVNCTTEEIPAGQTTTLDCFSGDELPSDYDTLTIRDTF
ncbi:DUF2510 domain-containing protein [Aeromicrobium sp. CF3.5]|uniref:DUF2510 domain-containing protein n=1 Tax=Aeromicrobium sp. CF3.5 TaxID=3373078 RepID=UPI003EE6C08A